MIPERLENRVRETLKPFAKKPVLYSSLYDELISHMQQEYFETQLQGKPEKEAVEEVLKRFGDPDSVGQNLAAVHNSWSKKHWALALVLIWYLASFTFGIVGALCGGIFGAGWGGSALVVLFSGINPLFILLSVATLITGAGGFIYVFIGVTLLGVLLLHGLSKVVSLPTLEREKFVAGTLISALCLCAVIFLISYHELPVGSGETIARPIAVTGFPWPAIYFPLPPLGNDTVPVWMWPKFFLDYACIWFIAIVTSFVLRNKWNLSRQRLLLALTAASFFMLQVLVWIALRFD